MWSVMTSLVVNIMDSTLVKVVKVFSNDLSDAICSINVVAPETAQLINIIETSANIVDSKNASRWGSDGKLFNKEEDPHHRKLLLDMVLEQVQEISQASPVPPRSPPPPTSAPTSGPSSGLSPTTVHVTPNFSPTI